MVNLAPGGLALFLLQHEIFIFRSLVPISGTLLDFIGILGRFFAFNFCSLINNMHKLLSQKS